MKKLTLTQFLKLLPGVAIDHAKELLGDGLSYFMKPGSGLGIMKSRTLKGVTIRLDELMSLGGDRRLDAPAANAILRLYKAAALPMKEGVAPSECSQAEAYSEAVGQHDAAEAAAREQEHQAFRDAARRRREIVDNPALATEADFCVALLNDIFFQHNGPGGGSLEIGGIAVTKSQPIPYASNSGKKRFWSYRYSWVSRETGKTVMLEQNAPTENNRRNDPLRNWGLPA
jgi:hypothetical protein